MKSIKIIAMLAMTLALASVLAACGGSNASSSAASSSAASEAASSEAAASESAAAESTEAAASESAAAESTEAAASESAAAESEEPNVYTNDFFKVKFTLPEGWKFGDTSSISQANSTLAQLSQGASIDMVAAPADSSAMVVITLHDVESANETAKDHLAAEVKELTDGIEGADGTYSYNTSDATIDFSDVRSLPAALTEIDVNGQKAYFFQACDVKDGTSMDITIMAQSQDDASKITENFSMPAE